MPRLKFWHSSPVNPHSQRLSKMTISSLADLIAQVESAGNQFAVRFESAYVPNGVNVLNMARKCQISQSTAYTLCKMSFGLFQIMGSNLVGMGLQVSPIEYCSDSIMQVDFFNRYCIANHINFTLDEILNDETKRKQFAHNYNGPGNVVNYSQILLDVYKARG